MTPRPLPRFSLEARREIRKELRWWKENREKNPLLLKKELRRAYTLLTNSPGVGALAPDTPPESGIRFMYFRGSRYLLYYSLLGDQVEVLRFWQASQEDRPFSPPPSRSKSRRR